MCTINTGAANHSFQIIVVSSHQPFNRNNNERKQTINDIKDAMKIDDATLNLFNVVVICVFLMILVVHMSIIPQIACSDFAMGF